MPNAVYIRIFKEFYQIMKQQTKFWIIFLIPKKNPIVITLKLKNNFLGKI